MGGILVMKTIRPRVEVSKKFGCVEATVWLENESSFCDLFDGRHGASLEWAKTIGGIGDDDLERPISLAKLRRIEDWAYVNGY